MRYETNTSPFSRSTGRPWGGESWTAGTRPHAAGADVPDLDWPEDLFSRDGAAADELETIQ